MFLKRFVMALYPCELLFIFDKHVNKYKYQEIVDRVDLMFFQNLIH
jgi:hypothetical protein